MKAINLDGESKEIADLVLALQGQRNQKFIPIDVIQKAFQRTIDGIAEAEPS